MLSFFSFPVILCGTFYDVLCCIIFRSRNKEYLPIVGLADFNKLSAKLIFGADRLITEEKKFSDFFFVKIFRDQ